MKTILKYNKMWVSKMFEKMSSANNHKDFYIALNKAVEDLNDIKETIDEFVLNGLLTEKDGFKIVPRLGNRYYTEKGIKAFTEILGKDKFEQVRYMRFKDLDTQFPKAVLENFEKMGLIERKENKGKVETI